MLVVALSSWRVEAVTVQWSVAVVVAADVVVVVVADVVAVGAADVVDVVVVHAVVPAQR
jgi:hypothetical protein